MRRRGATEIACATVACLLAVWTGGCGGGSEDGASDGGDTTRTIVATTPVLGSVVESVVGDSVEVATLMPNGSDPHSFSPSASEIDEMMEADLLVINGEDLEEGLEDAIDVAIDSGVPVFTATEHIEVREISRTSDGEEPADEHEHSGGDPHFWLDPVLMQDVVAALGPAIEAELGVDVSQGTDTFEDDLATLHAANEAAVAEVPESKRKLVTGHDSLGYWADRYGFEVIGAVIPSTSTQAEASSRQVADLSGLIREQGVSTIFTESGTSPAIAETIVSETGARLVELDVEILPDDGSYITLVSGLTQTIVANLG